MEPGGFRRDVEATAASLRSLAAMHDADELVTPDVAAMLRGRDIVLAGMGSSYFAAETCARRMRRAGVRAWAELASVDETFPPSNERVVVGITASGRSGETLGLLAQHRGVSATLALTNTDDGETLDALPSDAVAHLHAGVEEGGVACRSYVHTLATLMAWEHALAGTVPRLAEQMREAADAIDHLVASASEWLPVVGDVLAGPHGSWLLAPAERLSSALQGALMLREGPRRAADGCETGDWNHVDVYLTKTLEYRALVFAGSRFDVAAENWMRERGSRFVVVGTGHDDTVFTAAEHVVRHPHDHDPVVRLLAEITVADLVAADWWDRAAR